MLDVLVRSLEKVAVADPSSDGGTATSLSEIVAVNGGCEIGRDVAIDGSAATVWQ